MYFSFSPADAGEFNRQLKLPKGGAVISIVAQESLRGRQYHSLSEWAEADARGVSAERPSIRPFELSADTGVAAAIISSYDSATFGPDDQSEHRLNIFWEFRQQLFVAHLLYPTHDARGAEFEKVLLDTVRSIRRSETRRSVEGARGARPHTGAHQQKSRERNPGRWPNRCGTGVYESEP